MCSLKTALWTAHSSKAAVKKPVTKKTAVKKPKARVYASMEKFREDAIDVFEKISGHWVEEDEITVVETDWEKPSRYRLRIAYPSGDRGPRQDHGGDFGDDWMDSDELYSASSAYYKKWNPRVARIVQDLKDKGFQAEGNVDYDEKGYVDLVFYIYGNRK